MGEREMFNTYFLGTCCFQPEEGPEDEIRVASSMESPRTLVGEEVSTRGWDAGQNVPRASRTVQRDVGDEWFPEKFRQARVLG